jgi:hypothetical protein
MVRTAPLLLGMVLIPALILPARAQENPCERRTLPVSVVTKQGDPVDGLTAADFRGKFRGKPVQILSAEPDQRHRRIVIMVDASRSMFDPTIWSMACDIGADAYRHFRGKSSTALLVYSGTILKRVGFGGHTEDLAKLFAGLDLEKQTRPHESRKTALWDALQAAIDELHPADVGDVIYIITDAGNSGSKIEPSTLRQELAASEVRLFAFFITDPLQGAHIPDSAQGLGILLEMVRKSGGNSVFLTSSQIGYSDQFWDRKGQGNSIPARIGRLYKEMARFYRVEIRLEKPVNRPRNWKLEVLCKNGKPRRDVVVHYPQNLLPCHDTAPQ